MDVVETMPLIGSNVYLPLWISSLQLGWTVGELHN